ncbi:hypothetical protein ACFXB3_01495 [Streptomyces sp. NPDC059447]|uniref:hypothetical protein n=1 Tax=Streptomyces sp. NPDC059447 TaxID=3346834 RepID=UPI0036853039
MRPEVQGFVADGPLPDWDTEDEELVDRRYGQIEAITAPVTPDEAHALAACFGPDERPGPDADVWHHTLWNRWGNPDLGGAP